MFYSFSRLSERDLCVCSNRRAAHRKTRGKTIKTGFLWNQMNRA
nr:MAG TPA: hypothetical protein [Caudoviricetes sp.]